MSNELKQEIIKFYAWDDRVEALTLPPIPAVKNVPEYWKKTTRFLSNDNSVELLGEEGSEAMPNLGLKHCMPFFDALTAGYYYLLSCDIQVKIIDGVPSILSRAPLNPLSPHEDDKDLPAPMGCYTRRFSWQMWWGFKLPIGWSALITNPLNRPDLPITVTSGIVDNDNYTSPGNISFFIKEGFEGTIPMGTPIFQIIPIYRANWKAEIDQSLRQEGHIAQERKKNKLYGYYKKFIRTDRTYE